MRGRGDSPCRNQTSWEWGIWFLEFRREAGGLTVVLPRPGVALPQSLKGGPHETSTCDPCSNVDGHAELAGLRRDDLRGSLLAFVARNHDHNGADGGTWCVCFAAGLCRLKKLLVPALPDLKRAWRRVQEPSHFLP